MKAYVSAKDHYDDHLGIHYSWMTGDFLEAAARFRLFLAENFIQPRSNKIAVDLGAGHGIQSVPLAEAGFDVIAIDFNQHLLDELKVNARDLPITIRKSDIRRTSDWSVAPELIVCCGDTLSHLENRNELVEFIGGLSKSLLSGGKILLSFRDYSTELVGFDRIIPVKSDEEKILTCILDYETEFVNVTDLFYERRDARWEMTVSTYRKLRLTTPEVLNLLRINGLTVAYQNITRGFTTILAAKPA